MPRKAPISKLNPVNLLASTVIELASETSYQGTFGVGGVMLDPEGDVLKTIWNHVIQNGRVVDPTGHVERTLAAWYFEEKEKGTKLPPPKQCTIVTQLDPCMMCTGSILEGGFNVMTLALDTFAGICYKGHGDF